jgi:hypothetical protein
MNGGEGLSIGAIDGIAGPEERGKQDSGLKASTATQVKTVDPKPIPHNKAMQTGKQATMRDQKAEEGDSEPPVKARSSRLTAQNAKRGKAGVETDARGRK